MADNAKTISRLESAIYEIEQAINDCEENQAEGGQLVTEDIKVDQIILWFKSPFVSDFDKRKAIESYK